MHFPDVPKKEPRLRIGITVKHTREQVDDLVSKIEGFFAQAFVAKKVGAV